MSLAVDVLLGKDAKTQSDAYTELKHKAFTADQKLNSDYFDVKNLILQNSESIQVAVEQVVNTGQYTHCLRGIFGAMVIDLDSGINITGTAFNMPAPNMLDMCKLGEGVCTRSIMKPKHGTGYDLCPASHARERIYVPNDYPNYDSLIWIEAGAIRDSENKMKFWDIYNSHELHIYPCLRCLNTSLLQNVKTLAVLNYTDKWEVSFHDVKAHAELLFFSNCLNTINNF